MLIKYYIAYKFVLPDGRNGDGYAEIYRSKPITGIESLENIAEGLKERNGFATVIISDWKRFETEE